MYSKNNKQQKYISGILRKLMQEARIATVAELSKLCGVKQHTLNKILSGNTDFPRANTVSKIARTFNLSIEQLIGEAPIPENWAPGMEQNTIKVNWIYVPIIDWHASSTWKVRKKDYTAHTHKDWIASEHTISSNSFALKTQHFMEPHFKTHSIILIDPEKSPMDGQYVIVSIDEDVPTIRKLCKEGKKGYLETVSNNFSPRLLTPKDVVIGPVIECRLRV